MKKMIIMAAFVVAATAVNAASFKWTGANIYGASGTKFTGTAEMYAYLSTATVADAVKLTDIAINNGTIVSSVGSTTAGFTYDWSGATVGSLYNFYMVITDGDKVLDTSSLLTKSGTAQATSTTSVSFANMTSVTQTAGNWAAVPEPTSGLLLLLGMAGLALRRKQK